MFSKEVRAFFSAGLTRISRRNLLAATGFAAAAQQLRMSNPNPVSAAEAGTLRIGPDLFQSIGVRPLINCKGTFTIVSGSQSLPEVKQAMLEASSAMVIRTALSR